MLAVKGYKTEKNDNYPVVIVPHFDSFKKERRELLSTLRGKASPKKIVLFSVNHFALGQRDILTTNRVWDFKDVNVKTDSEGYQKLIKNPSVLGDDTPFFSEHGVKNVLPDLAEFFPKAEILPVIARDDISQEETEKIFNDIYDSIGDYMAIFSIDFSHYCPNSMAQIHDAHSISALKNLDENKAYLSETDSPQLMKMALMWAKKRQNEKFNLVFNSNSGLINSNDENETTSVVIGYFSPGDRDNDKTATMIFAGDVMLDRYVNHTFKDEGIKNAFLKIGPRLFRGADLSIVNLEGPISSKPIDDDTASDNLNFNFPPDTPEALKYLDLNSVSLANNHSLNGGEEGLQNTIKVLGDQQISVIGRPDNQGDLVRRLSSSLPISVLPVNELSNKADISDKIREEKTAGRFVVVYAHWGSEYADTHSTLQENAAKQWRESGADLVVGAHPHVIEDLSLIDKMPVVYSLGNFVFDQNFSRGTREGLVVGAVATDESIKISFFPVEIVGQAPRLIRGERRKEILTKLMGSSGSGYQVINCDTIQIDRN